MVVRLAWPTVACTRCAGAPRSRACLDGAPGDLSHAINTLGEAVAVLREQLTAERQRADQERTRADVALAQLRMAEELLKEAQIARAVEAAAARSWLFRWGKNR
jgi:hypothetical protein